METLRRRSLSRVTSDVGLIKVDGSGDGEKYPDLRES